MQTGGDNEKLVQFKEESTVKLESTISFQLRSWNQMFNLLRVKACHSPSKILEHNFMRNKEDDTLEMSTKPFPHEQPVTKRTILSYLATNTGNTSCV